ncbi:hypothetical protein IWX49DRAFT_550214 [Phyllosticta citricarpa]|uniref:Mid2 domain-containing protein n=2 Tax=Phyllosticta TaxID=121621 RepID=A0ABR1MMU2_9PEZI
MWNANLQIVLLSLLVRSSVADDDNVFTSPGTPGALGDFAGNPVWKPGSVQRVSWTTTLEAYDIALFHQKSKSGSGNQVRIVHTLDSNGSGDQSFDWTVDTYGTSTTSSSAFYFSVHSGSSDGFTSHYFNITSEASTTTRRTTSTSSRPTTSSTAAPRKMTTTTSKHAATKTKAATPKGNSSPKSGKKSGKSSKGGGLPTDTSPRAIGLGVGLGLGIPIVLIGAVFGFYMIKGSGPVRRIIERRQQRAMEQPVPVWCPDEGKFTYQRSGDDM